MFWFWKPGAVFRWTCSWAANDVVVRSILWRNSRGVWAKQIYGFAVGVLRQVIRKLENAASINIDNWMVIEFQQWNHTTIVDTSCIDKQSFDIQQRDARASAGRAGSEGRSLATADHAGVCVRVVCGHAAKRCAPDTGKSVCPIDFIKLTPIDAAHIGSVKRNDTDPPTHWLTDGRSVYKAPYRASWFPVCWWNPDVQRRPNLCKNCVDDAAEMKTIFFQSGGVIPHSFVWVTARVLPYLCLATVMLCQS